MNLPSKNDCFQLMCRMQMLENIVAHSIQVRRVGACLVDHIKREGGQLNRKLVQAAALLHDITKTRSFQTEENHALTGGQVLVNYADKRVLHDRIVSLDDRMRYIQERYGTQPEHKRRIELLWKKTAALEKHIFTYLPFSPDDLIDHLTPVDLSGEISNFRKVCPQPTGGNG